MLELFAKVAWQVVAAALVLGAGLPALFALGVRLAAPEQVPGTDVVVRPAPLARAGGLACVAVVVLAVAVGITVIVATGFGKQVSFEHVLPTLVDKK